MPQLQLSIDSGFHYRIFLNNFRMYNKDAQQIEVVYGDRVYCFKPGNFTLQGYKNSKIGQMVAINYNHVSVEGKVGKQAMKGYLSQQHNGKYMTEALSVIVALTAEAARSEVVQKAFCNVIDTASEFEQTDSTWKLKPKDFELLFKAYHHTGALVADYFVGGEAESPGVGWRPLKESDYVHYFETLPNDDVRKFRELRTKVDFMK